MPEISHDTPFFSLNSIYHFVAVLHIDLLGACSCARNSCTLFPCQIQGEDSRRGSKERIQGEDPSSISLPARFLPLDIVMGAQNSKGKQQKAPPV